MSFSFSLGRCALASKRWLEMTVFRAYEKMLTREVSSGLIPNHIAIIMDGNRRYAKMLHKPAHEGHRNGAQTTEKILDWCWELDVKNLSIYAFSTENFNRDQEEQSCLFELMEEEFEKLLDDERTHERGLRVSVVGESSKLPQSLRAMTKRVEKATTQYTTLKLNVAIAYGGRWEILGAARKLAHKVREGELEPAQVDEEAISEHLSCESGMVIPNVDLIIRTGGELRTSNFLPWQANGNECAAYFCTPYWPEFTKVEFLRAIRTYQQRESERKKHILLRLMSLVKECGLVEVQDAARIYKSLTEKAIGGRGRMVESAGADGGRRSGFPQPSHEE